MNTLTNEYLNIQYIRLEWYILSTFRDETTGGRFWQWCYILCRFGKLKSFSVGSTRPHLF